VLHLRDCGPGLGDSHNGFKNRRIADPFVLSLDDFVFPETRCAAPHFCPGNNYSIWPGYSTLRQVVSSTWAGWRSPATAYLPWRVWNVWV